MKHTARKCRNAVTKTGAQWYAFLLESCALGQLEGLSAVPLSEIRRDNKGRG